MAQTVSGKTAANIITAARYMVNDSLTPYFVGDTTMLQWVNDGRFVMCRDGHAIQTTENIDLVASTLEYTPTADYIDIVCVQYLNASSEYYTLKKGSPAAVDRDYGVNYPRFYYEFDGKIGVYPVLSSVTTEKVRLLLISRPTSDLELSGAIDTPGIYDLALTQYVAAQHMLHDRRFASHAQMMAKVDTAMYANRIELTKIDEK